MKLEHSTVTKLTICDVDRLDPITVYAEDIRQGVGRITFSCYKNAWTAGWSGMGNSTLAEFFCQFDEHYIAGGCGLAITQEYDPDAVKIFIKKQLCHERRRGLLTKKEARIEFDAIEEKVLSSDPWADHDLMSKTYGEEWWRQQPVKSTGDYVYLCRVIKAIQAAFAQINEKQAA